MKRLIAYLLLVCVYAGAPVSALPEARTKVRSLAAFKNGLGFVFRTGETQLQDGWAMIEPVPPAVLGTYWVGTTNPQARVTQVVSFNNQERRPANAVSFGELLAANVGKEVTIVYAPTSEAQTIRGTVIAFPKHASEAPSAPGSFVRNPPPDTSQIVLLKTSDGQTLALDKTFIRQVTLPGGSAFDLYRDVDIPRAKIQVSGGEKKAEIALSYIEKGINWSPGYLVDISDPKEASITLEAVLASDAEDLENTDVYFVVGFPNFAFADTITPLALQQSITELMQSLSRGPGSPAFGQLANVMRQSMGYGGYADETQTPIYSAGVSMAGEANEDLFTYQQKNVTLKKGDRARYTVFTTKAPYEHVYEWEIPDSMNIDDRGHRRSDSGPSTQDQAPVWHALRLVNKSKERWTTAPALTMRNNMPVAQDTLRYTPPGGRISLKLTATTDIKADQTQTEVSRTPVEIVRRTFDDVVVSGKLVVKNLKAETVKMHVTKSVVGEVKSSGQLSKVTRVAKKLDAYNPTSEIEWEFDLPAGQERELTYEYRVYISR